MAINLNDNIRVNAPKPSDDRFLNNTSVYLSELEANSLIPFARRHIGLFVNINNELYWYKDGVSDLDLIPFSSGTGGVGTLQEVIDAGNSYVSNSNFSTVASFSTSASFNTLQFYINNEAIELRAENNGNVYGYFNEYGQSMFTEIIVADNGGNEQIYMDAVFPGFYAYQSPSIKFETSNAQYYLQGSFINSGNLITDIWAGINLVGMGSNISSLNNDAGYINYDPTLTTVLQSGNTWNTDTGYLTIYNPFNFNYGQVGSNNFQLYSGPLDRIVTFDTEKISNTSNDFEVNITNQLIGKFFSYRYIDFNNFSIVDAAIQPYGIVTIDIDQKHLSGYFYPDYLGDGYTYTEQPNLRWAKPYINGIDRYEYLTIPNIIKPTPPTDANEFIFFVDAGGLKVKSPSGIVTTIALP